MSIYISVPLCVSLCLCTAQVALPTAFLPMHIAIALQTGSQPWLPAQLAVVIVVAVAAAAAGT